MINQLSQKEMGIISGGIVTEILVTSTLIGTYSALKTYQNGSCVKWQDSGWSSKASCYVTNIAEDAAFYGVVLTMVGAHFHQTAAKLKTL